MPVTPLLVSYFNARLLPLIRWTRARSRRRGHAAGHVGTDFWLPIAPVNRTLELLFAAGEVRDVAGRVEGRRPAGYSAGASLIAILRRDEGDIPIRHKPADCR